MASAFIIDKILKRTDRILFSKQIDKKVGPKAVDDMFYIAGRVCPQPKFYGHDTGKFKIPIDEAVEASEPILLERDP